MYTYQKNPPLPAYNWNRPTHSKTKKKTNRTQKESSKNKKGKENGHKQNVKYGERETKWPKDKLPLLLNFPAQIVPNIRR